MKRKAPGSLRRRRNLNIIHSLTAANYVGVYCNLLKTDKLQYTLGNVVMRLIKMNFSGILSLSSI